jgi:hypothetical protein
MAIVSTWRENCAWAAMMPTHTEKGRTQYTIWGKEKKRNCAIMDPFVLCSVNEFRFPKRIEIKTSSVRLKHAAAHMNNAFLKIYL